jgi:hypothetical protein
LLHGPFQRTVVFGGGASAMNTLQPFSVLTFSCACAGTLAQAIITAKHIAMILDFIPLLHELNCVRTVEGISNVRGL